MDCIYPREMTQNGIGSSLCLPTYYNCYPFDTYRPEECEFSAINSDIYSATPPNNDCEFGSWDMNSYYNSDSDSYLTGSRPSSTHLNENELRNNSCNMNTCEDATYLLSLPNQSEWTLASCRNVNTSSPALSGYADSRSSPMRSEISFDDDIRTSPTSQVFEGGRRTPPPPYRPPVNNTDILCESIIPKTISSKLLKPPPPYSSCVNHTTIQYETLNRLPGLPVDSGISENSPLTADRSQSATSSNWRTLPMQGEFQARAFAEKSAVGGERSTEVFVPADPELWNKEHINHWLTKVEHYYGIASIDRTHMPGDGESLCRLSADDFHRITGDRRTADILSNYIDCIKQNVKFSPSSQETSGDEKNKITFFEAIKNIVPLNKSSSPSGGGQIQLWQFLLELLVNPEHSSLIAWKGNDGTFQLLDPEGTAKLWGERKFKETRSKKPMNYDKLSRSLRHYYMKGIVKKVSGKRYTYQFNLDGVRRACSPSGVSDSIFIYSNFDLSTYDNAPRNFNLNL